jgi:hypothetical protein
MIRSYIFKEDLQKKYVESFNDYAISILYGNITIGNDIEDNYKDK